MLLHLLNSLSSFLSIMENVNIKIIFYLQIHLKVYQVVNDNILHQKIILSLFSLIITFINYFFMLNISFSIISNKLLYLPHNLTYKSLILNHLFYSFFFLLFILLKLIFFMLVSLNIKLENYSLMHSNLKFLLNHNSIFFYDNFHLINSLLFFFDFLSFTIAIF